MKIINTNKIPIKMWLENIEQSALDQASNLANLPFAYKHIAIMPDAHQGFGMPIGGVMATQNVIIPNAVGVDIGCGMCAVKTSLTDINTETLKKIMGKIREQIPLGFNKHKETQNVDLMPRHEQSREYPIISREFNNALKSVGTLGGGNHFIELQKGDDDHIWIMIHSGSRNLGFKVAAHYNDIAKELNAKWYSSITKDKALAFLPLDSKEGKDYIEEMKYCVEFALANRQLMMNIIKVIIWELMGRDNAVAITSMFEPMINIAHNYATMENHFGKNVMVHRKGATKATKGLIGIIPGSQGTNSYIVKGKGNKDSFNSCSHGAGRTMSRTAAKEKLNLKEEIKKLDNLGVIHGMRNTDDLDEAPSAYKDIDTVMKNQKDLVDIVTKLTPIAVIKASN